MSRPQVDYDPIADGYDQRFLHDTSTGISSSLQRLIKTFDVQRVLEVGCGTGHWLALLSNHVPSLYGLDLSGGMLLKARQRTLPVGLAQGRAEQLPFQTDRFDLIYCVNAIHHFNLPESFVHEGARLLRPGGLLAVIGSDPHDASHTWYVYDYFEGTYQTDLERFPSQQDIFSWMQADGFEDMQHRLANHIQDVRHGRDVLQDPFLEKEATSQLTLLSDGAYQAGLDRIQADLDKASARGEELSFRADIRIFMTWGRLSGP